VSRYVALLRGINVGGKNKLPMKDLVAMFCAAGCEDVEAYIQSGNVLFKARPPVAAKVPAAIASTIGARFGYRIPVVVRTAGEVEDVARSNPFLAAGQSPDTLHVAFLADKPRAGGVATLDAGRSPPDEFIVRGREIYLHLPNGVARSKLTSAYFDSILGTTSTMRNWKTVQRLLELTAR
jgi:uncharacterized protein (DUF1697 family)